MSIQSRSRSNREQEESLIIRLYKDIVYIYKIIIGQRFVAFIYLLI